MSEEDKLTAFDSSKTDAERDLEAAVAVGDRLRKRAGLDFGQALAAMREGRRVRRPGWLKWRIYFHMPVPAEVWSVTNLGELQSHRLHHIEIGDALARDWQVCDGQ